MPLHFNSAPLRSETALERSDKPSGTGKRSVRWHGAFWAQHSLAVVNREMALALRNNPDFDRDFALGVDHFDAVRADIQKEPRFSPLADAEQDANTDMPAVTVRHRWPPDFGRAAAGKLVVFQPWEFGSLPRQWVREIERGVDEVWVPSRFVRDTCTSSGVPGEKVTIVPYGVNTRVFHPGVTSQILEEEGKRKKEKGESSANDPFSFLLSPLSSGTYKFLFVGGTIARKGVDVLLDAYDRAFTAKDPVVLIIKDFGTDSFYANQGAGALIGALQSKPGAARIVYLNHDMSEAEIAGLYAACDCLVHPYRGEGYGLPIAEAMACGKPAIVTNFGAALDFANASNAYLIPAQSQRLTEKKIGDMATVDYPFWAAPDRDALSGLLRHVVAHPDEARAKGLQAASDIATLHTWDIAAQTALARLTALSDAGSASSAAFALPMGLGNLALGGLRLSSGLSRTGLGASNPAGINADTPGLRALGDMYEDRKQAALEEARRGAWAEAVAQLDACLVERPADWDVVNALGAACFQTGDKARAVALLRHGIARADSARDLHHNMAFVLLADERPEEAAEHALLALEITPDDPNIRRTIERAGTALLKKARALLRGVPDKQRAKARRAPQYCALMERYARTEEALRVKPEALSRQDNNAAPNASGVARSAQRLSLCMIVKNEERFLRNCLESVKGVVDEIVIVDTGSTDGTLAIAREYGAKIIEHAWNDDFAEARNVSLQHATGNWALWLDADEEIAPGSGATVRAAIQNAPATVGGYMVKFHNWLSAASRAEAGTVAAGEMAVHHACRLFRRVEGVRFEGRIHEQNLRSLQNMGYTYAHMDGLLIDHWGYAGEIMSLRNKHERFIRMLTREVEECPDEGFRAFHLFNLGNAYFTSGDMENAAYYFSQGADGVSAAEEFGVTLFVEWITALHRMGRAWDGLDACAQADELGMRQAGIEFARGYCLLHTEQYEAAEAAFQEAVAQGKEAAAGKRHDLAGDIGASTFKAQYGLALAVVGQERYDLAIEPCQAALEMQPGMTEARYLLTIALAHEDRTYEAGLELETLLAQAPSHDAARRDLCAIYCAAKDYAPALEHLRVAVWNAPDDEEALARLALCCEHLQLLEESRDAYERLSLLRPDSVEVRVNLGRVLAALDAPGEALDCYTQAIERDPTFGNAYFNAGDLMYRLGYYDRAAETYLAGLNVNPEQESGFFVLGNCYFQTQAYAAAVISYRQAVAQSPAHEEARHNLQLAEERAIEIGMPLPAA